MPFHLAKSFCGDPTVNVKKKKKTFQRFSCPVLSIPIYSTNFAYFLFKKNLVMKKDVCVCVCVSFRALDTRNIFPSKFLKKDSKTVRHHSAQVWILPLDLFASETRRQEIWRLWRDHNLTYKHTVNPTRAGSTFSTFGVTIHCITL